MVFTLENRGDVTKSLWFVFSAAGSALLVITTKEDINQTGNKPTRLRRGVEALGLGRSSTYPLADRPHPSASRDSGPDRPPAKSPHPSILAARHSEVVCEERLLQDLLDFVWIVVRIPASLARVLSDLGKHPR